MRPSILSSVLFLWATCLAVAAPAPTPDPVDRPIAPAGDVDAAMPLIRQLADPDPAVREEASAHLVKMGKPALPALRQAASSPDPEIGGRARQIIARIERRPIPGPPPDRDPARNTHSTRISVQAGRTTVDANENGRKIHIIKEPSGQIEVTITGYLDGKPATETWKAESPEELKEEDPDVHALFERYAGAGGVHIVGQGGQLRIQGNVVQGDIVQGGVGRGGFAPADPLIRLQHRITPDLAKLPPAESHAILQLLTQLRVARMMDKPDEAARLAAQLRERLLANNLDPADDLPAPAKPATRPAVEWGKRRTQKSERRTEERQSDEGEGGNAQQSSEPPPAALIERRTGIPRADALRTRRRALL